MGNEARKSSGFLGGDTARREMAVGRAAAAFSVLVGRLLEGKGMRRADLARRLGVDRATLTRQLSHRVDVRLSSMAGILWELDIALYDVIEEIGAGGGWKSREDVVHLAGAARPSLKLPAQRLAGAEDKEVAA